MAKPGTHGADETAMAIPRIVPPPGENVAFPQPLPAAEADRLKQIFRLQRRGDIAEAASRSRDIDLTLNVGGTELGQAMLGHVLADRYLGRFDRPAAAELTRWLASYGDLPEAPAIRALLMTRLPKGAPPPAAIRLDSLAADAPPPAVPGPEESTPAALALDRNAALDKTVWDTARTGADGAVARLLARLHGPGRTYLGELRGEAAQILFTLNRDQEAYDVGAPGAAAAALAGTEAGLAAWRMQRFDLARPMFEAAWHAELASPAQKAAAAFWAARAHLRTGDPAGYVPWMTRAARQANTFYGFLARRTLGLGFGFAPGGRQDREVLGTADLDSITAYPAGVRAFALLQIGESDRADAELRLLWPQVQHMTGMSRAIMLVARAAGLTDLSAQLADILQAADGRPRDDTRFAVPHLRPDGGFKIDPPLLYAIARAESEFSTTLVSSAGALGVMQVMPETVSLLTRIANPDPRALLADPEYNLDIGQRYVRYLTTLDVIGGDLIRTLASYNAGPGTVQRWAATIADGDDPLLYIEAIPLDETRAYVPRVLTYAWIYATRMHLPMPSLGDLAAGAWPRNAPRQ